MGTLLNSSDLLIIALRTRRRQWPGGPREDERPAQSAWYELPQTKIQISKDLWGDAAAEQEEGRAVRSGRASIKTPYCSAPERTSVTFASAPNDALSL